MTEFVSIIMPAYNAEEFISDSIRSIINQTYSHFELIVIDDCSMDRTVEKVMEFEDSRIIIFKNAENKGVAFSRNVGLRNAKWRYVAFCDSDDYWHNKKLEIQIPLLKNYPVVCSNYYMVDNCGNIIKEIKGPEEFDYSKLLRSNLIPNSSAIFDRNKTNPNIFQKKIGAEDYLMWLKLTNPDKKIFRIQKPLMYYKVHQNSLSANKVKSMLWTWNIYKNELNLNLIHSIKCLLNYIIINIKKHYF